MKYPDGQTVHIGDKLLIDGDEAVAVFSIDTGEFSETFPKDDWTYLKKGVMFQTKRLGLVFQEETSGDLELLERKSP
jgi:hypothetical protein